MGLLYMKVTGDSLEITEKNLKLKVRELKNCLYHGPTGIFSGSPDFYKYLSL